MIARVVNEPEPDPQLKPFRREGLGYVYEPEGLGIRLRADYIDHGKSDITAEVVVESTLPGVPQHQLRTRINLLVDARLNDLAKLLIQAVPNSSGWLQVVRAFSEGVIRAERAGEPFTLVGRMPTRLRPPDLVERILVSGKPTLLYAPGGIGKGYLATGMGVCVQSGCPFAGLKVQQGNVLYLDWEDDEEEADERIKEIARGFGIEPPVFHYRRMTHPLHRNVQPLAAYIDQHKISLLIIDSFELAAGSTEHGTYDEAAKRLYQALRMFGSVTSLLIDHVSEQARQNKTQINKAYGAVFKGNWARRAFEVKVDIGDKINHCGLYTFKTNRGETGAPIGIAIDFTVPGHVTFYREEVSDNPELRQALPLQHQIAHVLNQQGACTVKELTLAVKGVEDRASMDSVKSILNRYKGKRFVKLEPTDKWGLMPTRPIHLLQDDAPDEPDLVF